MSEQDFKNRYQSLNNNRNPSPELLETTRLRITANQENRPRQAVRYVWRAGAVAACAVVLAAALIAMPHLNLGGMIAQTSSIQGTATLKEESEHLQSPAQEESTKPANPIPSAPQGSTSSKGNAAQTNSEPRKFPDGSHVATDENGKKLCILNDLNGVSAGANLPMHGPATHRYVRLSEQEVFDYLGTAIQPELPAGLAAHPGEKSWQFIYTKASGDIFFDGCGFTYADRFDADGYPAANAKSLKILASKMGYRCGIYYCGEEPLVTNMHGTDVTFGKAKDQPVYTAEFKKDGVQYTVTGENLELIELYQAVRSLILS